MEHQVISIDYTSLGWKRLLTLELDKASEEGWTPILYAESGGRATVILARPKRSA